MHTLQCDKCRPPTLILSPLSPLLLHWIREQEIFGKLSFQDLPLPVRNYSARLSESNNSPLVPLTTESQKLEASVSDYDGNLSAGLFDILYMDIGVHFYPCLFQDHYYLQIKCVEQLPPPLPPHLYQNAFPS